jgi:hypothetical protein
MPRWNNWNVEYSHIGFLEDALSGHERVARFEREQDILFRIERAGNLSPVAALLVNRYTLSLADVISATAEFPAITCIVLVGPWCGCTEEAKAYAIKQGIGVFHPSQLLGALWYKNPLTYPK